ncbi:unnamed protein product [Lampetra planeri]
MDASLRAQRNLQRPPRLAAPAERPRHPKSPAASEGARHAASEGARHAEASAAPLRQSRRGVNGARSDVLGLVRKGLKLAPSIHCWMKASHAASGQLFGLIILNHDVGGEWDAQSERASEREGGGRHEQRPHSLILLQRTAPEASTSRALPRPRGHSATPHRGATHSMGVPS